MLFASKDGELVRATPRIFGAICPHCKKDVIPRCGSIKIWHWAHKADECIYNKEPETQWHLEWKYRALKLGLEIEKDVLGERKHIADIYNPKTNKVIEIQHSPISIDDIRDRCTYYSINDINLEWMFDRTNKYDKDNIKFEKMIEPGIYKYEETVQSYVIFELLKNWYDVSLHLKNHNYATMYRSADNSPILLRLNYMSQFNTKYQKFNGHNWVAQSGYGILHYFENFDIGQDDSYFERFKNIVIKESEAEEKHSQKIESQISAASIERIEVYQRQQIQEKLNKEKIRRLKIYSRI